MYQPENAALKLMDPDRIVSLLARWSRFAEADWYDLPGGEGGGKGGGQRLGCYGAGYGSWGVQTNQKYLSAMAVLADYLMKNPGAAGVDPQWALGRAISSLRFSLASHQSGKGTCTDGKKWGHTWISALGVERMMHGVYLIEKHLTDQDKEAVREMLVSEATWLYENYPIVGGLWNSSGKNKPESNLWNGALLWRAAETCPDHPQASAWREKAAGFLINSVSLPKDATDDSIVDGKPVRERHVGANFFPNFALDHHGYLNVGYMVICTSNAGIFHFDHKAQGWQMPESIHHNHKGLWDVIRTMIFADGRLARIGGDTRVRYAYCQEYLLPAILYAADKLGEKHGAHLLDGQLKLMEEEARYNADGGFYSKRLAWLRDENPYYFTRLEADRACVLGFGLTYGAPERLSLQANKPAQIVKPVESFESSVATVWSEPEHGAALHRSETRFASFSWRANGLMQGMCQSPNDGHLADWGNNLAGFVSPAHHIHQSANNGQPAKRVLESAGVWPFEGGFATIGSVREGVDSFLAEGWSAPGSTRHMLALVALADGRSVVGIQLARAPGYRTLIRRTCGLGFALCNDLFNGFKRTIEHSDGKFVLESPASLVDAGVITPVGLESAWVCVDDGRAGLVGLGARPVFSIMRSHERQAGAYQSLYVDRIGLGCIQKPVWFDADEVVLDTSWAVIAGARADECQKFSAAAKVTREEADDVRVSEVVGCDGRAHRVTADFGPAGLKVRYEIDGKLMVEGQAAGV